MSGVVWLNGSFLTRDEARVSVFDAGFQHAVGLFETMHGVGDRVFRLEKHIERLASSARELGLSESIRRSPLEDAVLHSVRRAGMERSRVRLTITGGDLNLLSSTARGPVDPTVLIVVQPATSYPEEMFERGVDVVVSDLRVNPLNPFEGHKTLSYWPRLRSLQRAASVGAGEAIVLQVSNHLAGGCVSNVFLVKEGRLVTPIARGEERQGAIPSPVLPGVTRAAVFDYARDVGLELDQRMLSVADLLDADEVFLTNSSWGVLPVVRVERKAIGAGDSGGERGAPGQVTKRLREAWLRALAEEGADA